MAGAMMLDYLGEKDAFFCVEEAAKQVLSGHLKSLDAGQMGLGTKEVGDLMVQLILT
jgi:3-isopropylmalate dehydrogenase